MKIKEKSRVFENFLRKFDQKWYKIEKICGNNGKFYSLKDKFSRDFVKTVQMSKETAFDLIFVQNVDKLSENKILKHGREV